MKTNTIPDPLSYREKITKTLQFIGGIWTIGLLFWGCSPFRNPERIILPDLSPPQFISLTAPTEISIIITFNEPTIIAVSHLSLEPELAIDGIMADGNEVHITVSSQVPGTRYTLTATAMDTNENSLQFIAAFYGFNPSLPDLIINEFITRGSSTHPDLLELKVINGGNMGGITCYQGTYGSWDSRLIFPSFPVREGDFILVHFKPQGLAEEINETESKDVSGGLDVSPSAYDFWVEEGTGLSGNNGVLTIYNYPGGIILDGVLYSNRTSESDDTYLGFGSKKVMERALELSTQGAWEQGSLQVRPEDGINPDASTATRSLCRDRNEDDTNTKHDWHIVPTRGSTFGQENCEEVYSK